MRKNSIRGVYGEMGSAWVSSDRRSDTFDFTWSTTWDEPTKPNGRTRGEPQLQGVDPVKREQAPG